VGRPGPGDGRGGWRGRPAGGPAGPVPPDVAARPGRGPGRQADRGNPRRSRRRLVTGPGRPGDLGIGDRVRFDGRDQTVIGVSGPAVRLADTGGEVVTGSGAGLRAGGGCNVGGARPRPGGPAGAGRRRAGMGAVSVRDGLPGEAVQEALWWQRHIVEVLTGVLPDAEGTVPRPEYDPAVFTLTRREQAKAAELTAAGHPVTASAIAK